ncbi:hypothetical protein [Streptomyces coffeae]|uniref:Uncharacterized protein n=1 Tax=Streptomyces coffeae TaxID=621382 RepID=A0ABS1NJJ7_9ACTN|nr:hypothetical protein [Streptomyces coffeae]MBL1100109.1 hypothetical protein [Streptomyces coffeae]
MGMYHSTYFAYGIRIPDDGPAWKLADRIDAELAKVKDQCPDVGHLQAGDYDRDMTFLVTQSAAVDLGAFKTVTPQTATGEQYVAWGEQLRAAAVSLGVDEIPEPGWLVVPDLS